MRTSIKSLSEMQEKLNALRATNAPATIEDSVATTVLRASDSHLVELARRAFRRGYRDTVALIHAEFLRRRSAEDVAA